MGYFKKYNFHAKNDLATFWAISGNIGQLFIPSSGHTVPFAQIFAKTYRHVVSYRVNDVEFAKIEILESTHRPLKSKCSSHSNSFYLSFSWPKFYFWRQNIADSDYNEMVPPLLVIFLNSATTKNRKEFVRVDIQHHCQFIWPRFSVILLPWCNNWNEVYLWQCDQIERFIGLLATF